MGEEREDEGSQKRFDPQLSRSAQKGRILAEILVMFRGGNRRFYF